MNWCDRANIVRRFYLGRDDEQRVSRCRAEIAQGVDRTIDDGFRTFVIQRGVALINAYHEAGETNEAFEELCDKAEGLAIAAARVGRGRGSIDIQIVAAVGMMVAQMYDEGTAGRLMVAFECGFGISNPQSRSEGVAWWRRR